MGPRMAGRVDPSGPRPPIPPWREGVDADRRKRRRRVTNQHATVRRLTASTAIAATGLGIGLFAQTGIEWAGPGGAQSAIVAVISTILPGAGLQAPAQPPSTAPRATPVVTTGGS
jgi:hypothetical protein